MRERLENKPAKEPIMFQALASCLVLCVLASATLAQTTQPVESAERKTYESPPEMTIDPAKKYTATIDTTSGKIVLELFASEAPKTVNSFVFLAREGFYNGTIFHRVIPGFMIQGGDPTGTGMGGPGYQFENENKDTQRTYTAGTVGMANAGPNTNGSQFFIMDADTTLPARDYTIFGKLTEGQEIVNAIAQSPRDRRDRPNEPITINSITIVEE
jgi:cyclophilin family peptidyl-prolyl cis-trans isomerase